MLAVIPARGGSKGIYQKNIRDVGGKPMICHQTQNAVDSVLIDHVVVATDSPTIAGVAEKYFEDKIEIVIRPLEISRDLSKTEETLLYVLNRIDADIIVTLEPTNPVSEIKYIDTCIKRVLLEGFDSCGCFVEDRDFFLDDPKKLHTRPMRQQNTPRLREAGGCWATKVETLLNTNDRLGGKFGRVIVPERVATHIDDEYGWRVADALLDSRNYFVKLDRPTPNYEEDYWGVVVDPDGVTRDRQQESKERKLFVSRHKEKIDYINELPAGKILDVGCGQGHLLSAVDKGWQKYGVDVSKMATKVAKKYGEIVCSTLQETGYLSNYFDIVTIVNVVEHVVDPVGLVKEIRRVLKPNGKLIMETPDFDGALARRFGNKFRLLHDKGHVSLFSLLGAHRMLIDLMFEVEQVSYPFFETDMFVDSNLQRLFDTTKTSPPFCGNIVTFYAYKK